MRFGANRKTEFLMKKNAVNCKGVSQLPISPWRVATAANTRVIIFQKHAFRVCADFDLRHTVELRNTILLLYTGFRDNVSS